MQQHKPCLRRDRVRAGCTDNHHRPGVCSIHCVLSEPVRESGAHVDERSRVRHACPHRSSDTGTNWHADSLALRFTHHIADARAHNSANHDPDRKPDPVTNEGSDNIHEDTDGCADPGSYCRAESCPHLPPDVRPDASTHPGAYYAGLREQLEGRKRDRH